VSNDLVAGVGDRLHRLRDTLGEHAAHHDTAANLRSVQHPQQPINATCRAIMPPRQGIRIECTRGQRISHRPDARRLAVGPALKGDVEHHCNMAAARPAKIARQPLNASALRHCIRIVH
jgi:hypothetical protein